MQISEIVQVDFARWFTCWIIHFSSLNFGFATWRWFHNLEVICNLIRSLEAISQPRVISQPRSIFAGWRHFRSPFCSSRMRGWSCEMALVCQRVVSQLRNTLRNFRSSFRSALRSCLQTTITSSFQLQFVHRLKRWTPDFPRFKTRYSMNEMDSSKYLKYVQQFPSSWISLDFSLCFSSLHSWLALAKNYEAPNLEFFI